MKIVHLSTVTKGAYLVEADKTLTLWLAPAESLKPDNSYFFDASGLRNMEKFREQWTQCERQLIVKVEKDPDTKLEEVVVDDRGFPVLNLTGLDTFETKPVVFERPNSVNAGIIDMYLLVDNNVRQWAVLNDLNKCVGCSGFGDTAGTGDFRNDPYELQY